MITDDQLVKLSKQLDNTFTGIATEYQVEPLSLAAIAIARLIHLTGHSDNMFKLLSEIGRGELTKVPERILQ